MESYKIENLNFSYPNGKSVLKNISFTVNSGEFITVCGKSGSGKTTLLKHLNPILAPEGGRSGQILFCGNDIFSLTKREVCENIGFAVQNPDNGIVTDKVWHELVFGAENLGLDQNTIRARAAETASFLGLENIFYSDTSTLSGGQKQILNLASVLVMRPKAIILDEPTGRLDPIAASEFLRLLKKINTETGITVIMSSHRLDEALELSDKLAVMDGGRLVSFDTPKTAAANSEIFMSLPSFAKAYFCLDGGADCPLTVREGGAWLDEFSKTHEYDRSEIIDESINTDTVIDVCGVWFRYEKNSADIVKNLSLSVKKGEFYAINGGNGAGKTTLLSLLSGVNRPYRGKIKTNAKTALLPQNPQSLFVKSTVYEDFLEVCTDNGRIKEVCALCGVGGLLKSSIYDVSGGEQQRCALAKLILAEPDVFLLDEPTKGLDGFFKEKIAEILLSLKNSGKTIIAVSHDLDFCAEYADRCGLFFDGRIVSENTPHKFFADKDFYTTSAHRMSKAALENAVTAADIVRAFGKEPPKISAEKTDSFDVPDIKKKPLVTACEKPKKPWEFLVYFLAVPLTVLLGRYAFGDRKYYFISMLIIFEILLPFAVRLEKRRPKAREITVLAVMCAAAVFGRTAFYAFPQVKPAAAVVIVTGLCLGAECGFITGAVTAFVSNMFFGQGPWTPWQMLALGAVGFFTGASSRYIGKNKLCVSLYGAAAVFVIYGGIMNAASVLMSQNTLNLGMFLASETAGAPFDAVHAVSTAVFLWLIARPFCEKLSRIKLKHGLYKSV